MPWTPESGRPDAPSISAHTNTPIAVRDDPPPPLPWDKETNIKVALCKISLIANGFFSVHDDREAAHKRHARLARRVAAVEVVRLAAIVSVVVVVVVSSHAAEKARVKEGIERCAFCANNKIAALADDEEDDEEEEESPKISADVRFIAVDFGESFMILVTTRN